MKKLLRTMVGGFLASFVVMQVAYAAESGQQAPPPMLLERSSPLGFDETLARIEANAKELGWKVPKKWKVNFRGNMKTADDVLRREMRQMESAPASAAAIASRIAAVGRVSVSLRSTAEALKRSRVSIGWVRSKKLRKSQRV